MEQLAFVLIRKWHGLMDHVPKRLDSFVRDKKMVIKKLNYLNT